MTNHPQEKYYLNQDFFLKLKELEKNPVVFFLGQNLAITLLFNHSGYLDDDFRQEENRGGIYYGDNFHLLEPPRGGGHL